MTPALRCFCRALFLLSGSLLSCRWQRTELQVSVAVELPHGPGLFLRALRLRASTGALRSDPNDGTVVSLPAGEGPFTFGVRAEPDGVAGPVVVEVTGCTDDRCEQTPAVRARVAGAFQAGMAPPVSVRLTRDCLYVSCGESETCEPDTGLCVSATSSTPTTTTQIAAGGGASCVLRPNGSVRCWGGVGTIFSSLDTPGIRSNTPVDLSVQRVRSVALGGGHGCVVNEDRTVSCFGQNDRGQTGAVLSAENPRPTVIAGLSNVRAVTAAGRSSCALLLDGSVRCWGELQEDPVVSTLVAANTSPRLIEGVSDTAQLASAPLHHCAVGNDGKVRCWGFGQAGVLGRGDDRGAAGTTRSPATVVQGLPRALEVATGMFFSCARTYGCVEGVESCNVGLAVYCWGNNSFGQLGNGREASSLTPVRVAELVEPVQLTAGEHHACARSKTGTISCWGANDLGQLGDGSRTLARMPRLVAGLANVLEVRAGNQHTCVRGRTSVQCWGSDASGALALERERFRTRPVVVRGVAPLGNSATPADQQRREDREDLAARVSLAAGQTCANTGLGARCWGVLETGEQFIEATFQSTRLSQIEEPTPIVGLPAPVRSLVTGASSTCVLSTDGTVLCWGSNSFGQLGDGTQQSHSDPRPVRLSGRASQLSVGTFTACALLDNNEVHCWGNNGAAVLGRFSSEACGSGGHCSTTAAAVEGFPERATIHEVGVGDVHACAIVSTVSVDRGVWCWGGNPNGQRGGSARNLQQQPQQVYGLTRVQELAIGGQHSCARLQDGSVRCWGSNRTFQLGARAPEVCSGSACSSVPLLVSGLSRNVVQLTAGSLHNCARLQDRTVRCWGANTYQQIGAVPVVGCDDGACVPTPTLVPGSEGSAGVEAGRLSSCVLQANGTVRCVGTGDFGEVGSGSRGLTPTLQPLVYRSTPDTAAQPLQDVAEVSLNIGHGCVRQNNGSVWCWGRNEDGRAGAITPLNSLTPVAVRLPAPPRSVVQGAYATLALLSNGETYGWGFDSSALFLSPERRFAVWPELIPSLRGVEQMTLSVTQEFACLRDAQRGVACWGQTQSGALGDGQLVSQHSTPTRIASLDDVSAVHAGAGHACVLRGDGSVWCWGANSEAQLGDGTLVSRATPERVQELSQVRSLVAGLYHNCALLNDRTVRCWGANWAGQLGDGSFEQRVERPTTVRSLRNVEQISSGDRSTCALTDTGEVWCWGAAVAQLVAGYSLTDQNARVPVRIPLAGPAVAVAALYGTGCAALRSDGAVYCWGSGEFGLRGDGLTDFRTAPMLVSGLRDVTTLTAGYASFCATRRNGEVFCWGSNLHGQLGQGYTTSVDAALSVPGLQNVREISVGLGNGCARLNDNTLRCWGANALGTRGNLLVGTRNPLTEPFGVYDVLQVSSGEGFVCTLVRNGTVRCWGANHRGQSGQPRSDVVAVMSEVRAIENATEVAAGGAHACALRADGTVRCWGANDRGQLGAATSGTCEAINCMARECPPVPCAREPVQVQGLSGVRHLYAGGAHTCAVLEDGSVRCWGANTRGQLGDGTTRDQVQPVLVRGVSGVQSMALSRSVRCAFPGAASNVSFPQCITDGNDHTCARQSGGTVRCWGANDRGQLGEGSQSDRNQPVDVMGLSDVSGIYAGGAHTCARHGSSFSCWGDDAWSQLGTGNTISSNRPVTVNAL